MSATIAWLRRHPVKGLTPEPLDEVALEPGACFPVDRAFAVEVGPSGFDPEHPRWITKMRFTVLARFPELARLQTQFNDATGVLSIGDRHGFGVDLQLKEEAGRRALADFLQAYTGEAAPFRVLEGPGAHRFMDDTAGQVSIVNLATVRALATAIGRPVDPLRFRANLYVEGWPAWAEDELGKSTEIGAGEATLRLQKPIPRCVATHVDPENGIADIDVVQELRTHFDRVTLGVYCRVTGGGQVRIGDDFSPSSLI